MIDQTEDAGHTAAALRSSALSDTDRQSCDCHLQLSVFYFSLFFPLTPSCTCLICTNVHMQKYKRDRHFLTALEQSNYF